MKRVTFLSICLLLIALPRISQAKPGDLDMGFGGDGYGVARFHGPIEKTETKGEVFYQEVVPVMMQASMILPNGQIVAAGIGNNPELKTKGFGMVRFLANGTIDPSFGKNGFALPTTSYNFGEEESAELVAITRQPNDQFVAAGSFHIIRELINNLTPEVKAALTQEELEQIWQKQYNADMGLMRFNADGSLDTSFGDQGFVYANLGKWDTAFALALQADGKILLGGQVSNSGEYSFPILRYDSSGKLDPTFGANTLKPGVVSTSFGKYNCPMVGGQAYVPSTVESLSVQPDGKIVAAGTYYEPGGGYHATLVRLLPNGDPDPSFGQGGKFVYDPGFKILKARHVQQHDGKIVLSMVQWKDYTERVDGEDIALELIRLNGDGSQNTTFGPEKLGKVSVIIQANDYFSLSVQSDEKLVVSTIYDLIRFQADGTPDPSFGSNGKVKLWNESSLHSDVPNSPWITTNHGVAFDGLFVQATRHLSTSDGRILVSGSGHLKLNSPLPDTACNFYNVNPPYLRLAFEDKDPWSAYCDKPENFLFISETFDGILAYQGYECDGKLTWFQDQDGDGYGKGAQSTQQCPPPPGYVLNSKDCNDYDFDMGPGGLTNYYKDQDGDGEGAGNEIKACQKPEGYSSAPGDCDDGNPKINHWAKEICNGISDDCGPVADNIIPEPCTTGLLGVCGAGMTSCENAQTKCNQTQQPGPESCNGLDDDCDGAVDEDSPSGSLSFYPDNDGDSFGDGKAQPLVSCTKPNDGKQYATNNLDCDDTKKEIHPDMEELCNETDDNCNGQDDEGLEKTKKVCIDGDQDQWCQTGSTIWTCPESTPQGYSAAKNIDTSIMDPLVPGGISSDCDDSNPGISPDAPDQTCNGIDENCNKVADDKFVPSACSTDKLGACQAGTLHCQSGATTCDQNNQPASESCNGLDDDCDGAVDEDSPSGSLSFYPDNDGDSFGDGKAQPVVSCTKPNDGKQYVTNNLDCDDTKKEIHPDMEDNCNDTDDNCNGQIDEEALSSPYYQDLDGDGFGDAAVSKTKCNQPQGYVPNNKDCDDTSVDAPKKFPGNPEACDGLDNNCNGQADEGELGGDSCDSGEPGTCGPGTSACQSGTLKCISNADPFGEICDGIDNDCDTKVDDADESVTGQTTYYFDNDKDGFGDPTQSKKACAKPAGYVLDAECNDNDPEINPDMEEICGNGKDDNCYAADDC